MEGIITNFEFSLPFRAIVLIAICAWASLLSHKCISNFNDGARTRLSGIDGRPDDAC